MLHQEENMDKLLNMANDLLKNGCFAHAFCGGYALDLFLGTSIRKHGDIDICAFLEDRNNIIDYMIKIGWKIYEFCGNGIIHLLENRCNSIHKSNLMCTYKNCELLQLTKMENDDYFYHKFMDVGITELNYIEFLFNDRFNDKIIFDKRWNIERNINEAIMESSGIKYLAPEIVLYFKSYSLEDKNQLDYDKTINLLNKTQKEWLKESLQKKYKNEHLWLNS
jgi:hypothetical protein